MKKFGAWLMLCLVAVGLTACTTFHDAQTYELAEDNPLVTTLMVRLNDEIAFDAALFQALPSQIKQYAATQDPDESAVKITDAKWLEDTTTNLGDGYLYSLALTLENVPPQSVQILVQPFTKVRVQTVFNPISLLPPLPAFTYYLSFTSSRRHSQVSTDLIQAQPNGDYVYFWDNGGEIVFTDRYPNTPLYYLLTLVAVVVIGVVSYFIFRYFDCKKRRETL